MKLIALFLSFAVFTGYVAYITIRFGWLRSISISWYHLKAGERWKFTIALWLFAIPIAIAGDTALSFLAAAGICFCGAAGDAKNDQVTERVHVIGATGGIILGIAALILDFGLWYLALPYIVFAYYMIRKQVKNHTFWIEVSAFYLIWAGILINLLK